MAITAYEFVTVQSDFVTADLIVWRRYRMRSTGIVEAMLDLNPHLAIIHQEGPFLPIGTQVRVPIDLEMLKGAPQVRNMITLYGKVK